MIADVAGGEFAEAPSSLPPEPSSAAARPVYSSRGPEEADSYPAVVARLNDRWRVIECRDGMQWILQQRKGHREGQAVWRGRRFHCDRKALINSIQKLVGLNAQLDLPELHPDRAVRHDGLTTLMHMHVLDRHLLLSLVEAML